MQKSFQPDLQCYGSVSTTSIVTCSITIKKDTQNLFKYCYLNKFPLNLIKLLLYLQPIIPTHNNKSPPKSAADNKNSFLSTYQKTMYQKIHGSVYSTSISLMLNSFPCNRYVRSLPQCGQILPYLTVG